MRREVSLVAAGTALLALASCAYRPPPSYLAPPPPAALPTPPAGRLSDRQFVDSAAASGMSEVELGRLALSRAAAPAVRSFARRMIDDHGRLNAELTAVARRLDLPPAPG
ncbi:MAG TPA: DUF4142 domain-containing protein, partial [Stellaceae bacterium]|nr:DUF4142 domain-containing protein [Stellaceae bacterium]